jgi:hypothetical protein
VAVNIILQLKIGAYGLADDGLLPIERSGLPCLLACAHTRTHTAAPQPYNKNRKFADQPASTTIGTPDGFG